MAWKGEVQQRATEIKNDNFYQGLSHLDELPIERGVFHENTKQEARLLRARYLAACVIRHDPHLTPDMLEESIGKMHELQESDQRLLVKHLLSWPRTKDKDLIRDTLEYRLDHLTRDEIDLLKPSPDVDAHTPEPIQRRRFEQLGKAVRQVLKEIEERPGFSHGLNDSELENLCTDARKLAKNLRFTSADFLLELKGLNYRVPEVSDILDHGLRLQLEQVDQKYHRQFRQTREIDSPSARPYEPFPMSKEIETALKDYAKAACNDLNKTLLGLDEKDEDTEKEDRLLFSMLEQFEKHGYVHPGIFRKGIRQYFKPTDFETGKPFLMPSYCSSTFFENLRNTYVDESKPFMFEIVGKNTIDLSGAMSVNRQNKPDGEIINKKNTWFLPIQKRFDPSCVMANCEDGMFVMRVKEMNIPARFEAWLPPAE